MMQYLSIRYTSERREADLRRELASDWKVEPPDTRRPLFVHRSRQTMVGPKNCRALWGQPCELSLSSCQKVVAGLK